MNQFHTRCHSLCCHVSFRCVYGFAWSILSTSMYLCVHVSVSVALCIRLSWIVSFLGNMCSSIVQFSRCGHCTTSEVFIVTAAAALTSTNVVYAQKGARIQINGVARLRVCMYTHEWSTVVKGSSTKQNGSAEEKKVNGITLVRPLWFTRYIRMINDVVSLLSFIYFFSTLESFSFVRSASNFLVPAIFISPLIRSIV